RWRSSPARTRARAAAGALRRDRADTLARVTAVLFTCAGQRVDIVSAFGRAGAITIAADVNPLAPALYHADRYAILPPAAAPAHLPFPVLVKARLGFGSRHIYRAHDREELDFFLSHTPVDSIVQKACEGEEFSVDVLCDMEGRCLNAIPRTMIESKGGESIKGMTIKDAELIELGRAVAEALPLAGPANIQCFREPEGRLEVTDVNPRFGGAFPLPTAAG